MFNKGENHHPKGTTWKTAVATLISINLNPLKPAIQLPKNYGTFLCFPGWGSKVGKKQKQ